MRKIYILPNLFTTANMFCGFLAMISSIQGKFTHASWLIIIAMVFDSMDGRIARMTRATSKFGVEYDSLSDLISFGVAPALLSYLWCLQPYGRLGWLTSFIYMACVALRLARFNVMTDVVPKNYFQGLPSPFAAASVVTLIIFYSEMELQLPKVNLMFGILLFMSTLMISSVHFPSFKDFKVNKENSFGVLAVGMMMMVLIAARPEIALFALVHLYIFVSFFVGVARIVTGEKESKVPVSKEKTS